MTNKSNPNDPYAKAGVNIDDGNALIKLIQSSVNATHNKSVTVSYTHLTLPTKALV